MAQFVRGGDRCVGTGGAAWSVSRFVRQVFSPKDWMSAWEDLAPGAFFSFAGCDRNKQNSKSSR